MTFEEIWRACNFLIALVALIWLIIDFKIVYNELSSRRLYLTFSLGVFLLAVVIGAWENTIQGNPVGIRTSLATSASLLAIFGLYVGRKVPPSK